MKNLILFLVLMIFSLSTYSQYERSQLTTEEFNKQIESLLENKKILKKVALKNDFDELTVYVDCNKYDYLCREEPFSNQKYNAHYTFFYWDKESIFFNITDSMPRMELINIKTGAKNIDIELITRTSDRKEYFIQMRLVDFDDEKNEEIPPKIEKINISKIKKI
ncbi:MAG: hypothetical protein JXR36_09265 [Bacteroidales bacterium]|nr:hypothetical protein [Bacteroidales bacterium]